MLEILNDLWSQYAERARLLLENPLHAAPLQNPIDESIRWQIHRDPIFATQCPRASNLRNTLAARRDSLIWCPGSLPAGRVETEPVGAGAQAASRTRPTVVECRCRMAVARYRGS